MLTEHVKLGFFPLCVAQVSGKWFSSLAQGWEPGPPVLHPGSSADAFSSMGTPQDNLILHFQRGWQIPLIKEGFAAIPVEEKSWKCSSRGCTCKEWLLFASQGCPTAPVPPWLFPAVSLHPLLPPNPRDGSGPAALTIYLHLEQFQNLHCCLF